MEKYIIECQNEQEWNDVILKTGGTLRSYTENKASYPHETISIDNFKDQWSGSSYFIKCRNKEYKDYTFISAQEYLNSEFVPLIFN